MKKYILTIAAAIAFLSSCEEFQPVFTGKYDSYVKARIWKDADLTDEGFTRISIKDLKDIYRNNGGEPHTFDNDEKSFIKGQVVSSDSTGNFYKSLYIQDNTGGIELRLGKYNLCNEYKINSTSANAGNQWVYVKLKDLTVGAYNGSLQVGFEDESGKYETSYIEVQRIIDTHILKGEMGPKVEPQPLVEADLNGMYSDKLETLVKIKGLRYSNEIFCLLYLNPNLPSAEKDKNHSSQRVFLSDNTCGVTTWAMSEEQFKKNLAGYTDENGVEHAPLWDNLKNGSDTYHPEISNKTVQWLRTEGGKEEKERKSKYGYFVPAAYTVSQNFSLGSKICPIRTSGYAKFCDQQIPAEILGGSPVTVVGIVTYYGGSSTPEYQITVNDIKDITY